MKKCFKLLGLVLLATTLTMSLASCGDKDEPAQEQQHDNPDNPDNPDDPDDPDDPEENPFEGMDAGQVKVKFQGQDILLEYPYINKYYEIPASGGIWAINFVGAKAQGAQANQVVLPQTRLVADLATNEHLNPYLNWYMSDQATKWNDLVVSYQDGSKDTFQVGDYFYGGPNTCGEIQVSRFNYNALRKLVTAKVTVDMLNFDDATGGVADPRKETVTFYFYKFQTDDQMPQSKSMVDPQKRFNQNLTKKGEIVSYSRL
jgi:hypothetical protein